MKRLAAALLMLSAAGLPAVAQTAPRASAAPGAAAVPSTYVAPATFWEAVDRSAAAPDFIGLAVAVVRNGKIETVRTYGVRSAGGTEPVTPDTVFRIASLSKAFGATLAGMAVREGKIAWTDKVTDDVPYFRLKGGRETKVTVEDILSHRVGLPPYAYDNLLEADQTPQAILGRYQEVKPTCEPHTCFSYQNTTFNMIAPILEKAEGAPYAALIRSRIFEPLGMRTASMGMRSLTSSTNWAAPHRRTAGAWRPVSVKEPYYRVPAAGGVNASITDMALWLGAQMGSNPTALPPELVAELTTPLVSTPTETQRQRALRTHVKSTHYGLGWRIMNYSGHRVINHTGSVEGYIAHIAWLPDRKSGIVVLSNTRGARATKIMPTWLDYELGLPRTDWLGLEDLAALEAETTGHEGSGGR